MVGGKSSIRSWRVEKREIIKKKRRSGFWSFKLDVVLPKLQYCRVTSKLCAGGVISGRVSELSSPYDAVDRHFCNFFPPCDLDLRSIESPAPPQLPIMEGGRPVGQPRPRMGLLVAGTTPLPLTPLTGPVALLMPLLDAIELVAVRTAPVLLEQRSWIGAVLSEGMLDPPPLLLLLLKLFVPPLPTAVPATPELDASPFICFSCGVSKMAGVVKVLDFKLSIN